VKRFINYYTLDINKKGAHIGHLFYFEDLTLSGLPASADKEYPLFK